ncbi:MAG: heavy metal-associated domain-containing protein [Cryomorphaceae bacterium]
MKKVQLILAFCAIAMISFANNPGEITVKSSVVCEMCKETIEEGLAYEKGIKRVAVDVEANTIFVKYNDKKLSDDEVKNLIAGLGYAADDVKPVKEAYDNLHGCCKMPGACGDK